MWVCFFAPVDLCSLGAFPFLDEAFPDGDPSSIAQFPSCCQVHGTKWTESSIHCTSFHSDQTAISIRSKGIPADDGADACDVQSLMGGMLGSSVDEASSSAYGSDVQIVLDDSLFDSPTGWAPPFLFCMRLLPQVRLLLLWGSGEILRPFMTPLLSHQLVYS